MTFSIIQFKVCAQEISNREGQDLPEMSEHDGQLFMRCMREVAARPRPSAPVATVAASAPSPARARAATAEYPTWLTPDRPSDVAATHEAFLTPGVEHGSSSGYTPTGGDRPAGGPIEPIDDHDDPPLYEDQPPTKPKGTQSKQFSARIEPGRGKKAQRISGIITAALYEDDRKKK